MLLLGQPTAQGECWPSVDSYCRHRVSYSIQYVSVQYQLERNFNFGIQFIQYAGYQSHHELSSGYPTQSQLSKIEKHENQFALFRRIMLQFLSSKQKTTRKLQGTAKPCQVGHICQSPAQALRAASRAPTTRSWTWDGMPTTGRQQTARNTDSLPGLRALLGLSRQNPVHRMRTTLHNIHSGGMKGSPKQYIRLFDVSRVLSKWRKGMLCRSNEVLRLCESKCYVYASVAFCNSRDDNGYSTTIHGDGTANCNSFQEGGPTTYLEGISPACECDAAEKALPAATVRTAAREVC
ncbi:hypothetical protein SS50377_28491 [Spironucleus salmonicida]|uniref:Uncharacterized protein n=1 Tax=Spironucleus salmonicida TaxID=348837 RepID=A0A9P8LK11_9EUKA|nr:hypothetical protein SS50377_28491 [Spironucleus salmonicida]